MEMQEILDRLTAIEIKAEEGDVEIVELVERLRLDIGIALRRKGVAFV